MQASVEQLFGPMSMLLRLQGQWAQRRHWGSSGSSGWFCKSITPSTPKDHMPTLSREADHHQAFTHTHPQTFTAHQLKVSEKKVVDLHNLKNGPSSSSSTKTGGHVCVYSSLYTLCLARFACHSFQPIECSIPMNTVFTCLTCNAPVQNIHSGIPVRDYILGQFRNHILARYQL